MQRMYPILWLTGNTGAGKTTLAKGVQYYYNQIAHDHPLAGRVIILDGDEMRATISTEETLTPEDRRRHNLRVARLAGLLQSQGFLVIVSVIAPFDKVRDEVSSICNPQWIYIKRKNLEGADRPYEAPAQPTLTIDNDQVDIAGAQNLLKGYIEEHVAAGDRVIA
jgi:adenylylsulfate kinase-like enzyme